MTMVRLASFVGIDGLLVEAEGLLLDLVKGCSDGRPSLDCYNALSSLAVVLKERGSRTLVTEDGIAQQKSRLARGVEAAKLAKRHADAIGRKSLMQMAYSDFEYSRYLYATFVGDEKLSKRSSGNVTKQAKELYKDLFSGKEKDLDTREADSDAFATAFNNATAIAVNDLSLVDAELLSAVIFISKVSTATSGNEKTYQWAVSYQRLGVLLHLLWKKNGDLTILERGIASYEKVFDVVDSNLPFQLPQLQVGFAVLLSDYGRAKQEPSYLKHAIMTFMAAAHNFQRRGQPLDKSSAIREMGVSLRRLRLIEQGHCWEAMEKTATTESEAIESLAVGIRDFERKGTELAKRIGAVTIDEARDSLLSERGKLEVLSKQMLEAAEPSKRAETRKVYDRQRLKVDELATPVAQIGELQDVIVDRMVKVNLQISEADKLLEGLAKKCLTTIPQSPSLRRIS